MTENEGFYWKLSDSFSYSCHEHPSYDIWSSTVTRAGTADAVIIAYKHLYPTSHKTPIMEHYPVSSARHTSLKPQHKMKKSQCKQEKKKNQPPNQTIPLQSPSSLKHSLQRIQPALQDYAQNTLLAAIASTKVLLLPCVELKKKRKSKKNKKKKKKKKIHSNKLAEHKDQSH